jgi:hypothetical protein
MKRRFSTTPSKILGLTSRHHSALITRDWLTHHLFQVIHHAPPNSLPPYTVQDTAEEVWTNRFRAVARILTHTIDRARIEAEYTQLTSCIEETSIATFEQRKEYSLWGARWWNDDCQQAVTTLRNATMSETRKTAQKLSVQPFEQPKRNRRTASYTTPRLAPWPATTKHPGSKH